MIVEQIFALPGVGRLLLGGIFYAAYLVLVIALTAGG